VGRVGYLDALAAKFRCYISDLRLIPAMRIEAVNYLMSFLPETDRQQEWKEAIDYLTGEEEHNAEK
jgi:hypothetical protein